MFGGHTTHIKITVFLCLLIQLVFGGTTGKLVGRVTSKINGEPLIGANVILEGIGIGTATDLEGRYFILQIYPGEYDIRFTMIGYRMLFFVMSASVLT